MSRFFVKVAALLLAGCAPVNTVDKATPAGRPSTEAIKRVVMDGNLGRKARVESVYVDEHSKPMRVQVNLRNTSTFDKDFKYRFEWFDARSMALYEPSDAWTRQSIAGGQYTTIEGVAPGADAVDWRLSIQDWSR